MAEGGGRVWKRFCGRRNQDLIFRIVKLEMPMGYTSFLTDIKGMKGLHRTEVTCGVVDSWGHSYWWPFLTSSRGVPMSTCMPAKVRYTRGAYGTKLSQDMMAPRSNTDTSFGAKKTVTFHRKMAFASHHNCK